MFIKVLILTFFFCVESNFLVREQHEVVNQNFCSFFQRFFWMNTSIALNIKNKFFVVSLLFHTEILYCVFHVTDRSKDGINRNVSNRSIQWFVFLSRNISTSFVNCDFKFCFCISFHCANNMVRIQYLKRRSSFADISCSELFFSAEINSYFFVINSFNLFFETNLFEVENNLCNIFHNSFYRGEFMINSFDTDAGDGMTFERRKKNSAECVSYSNTVSRLKRTKFKLTFSVG